MSDNDSANFPPLVSREQAGNKIGRALRLFVGRGRQFSVKELSNATGVKDRVIECAMCPPDSVDYRPLPTDALLSIASFLGPVFTSAWLELAGQVARDDGPLDHEAIAAWTADYNAKSLAYRRADSEEQERFGPTELADLGDTVVQFPGGAVA